MVTTAEKVAAFRAAHRRGQPLLLANAWDLGSARFLAGLGFEALATTSSGFAATLGRRDYRVTRDEALTHAAARRKILVLLAGSSLLGGSLERWRLDDGASSPLINPRF